MTNEKLIASIRKAKIKVNCYVAGFYIFSIFVDLYFTIYLEKVSGSLASKSPFSFVPVACLMLAVSLTFTYLEKILIAINQDKSQ